MEEYNEVLSESDFKFLKDHSDYFVDWRLSLG